MQAHAAVAAASFAVVADFLAFVALPLASGPMTLDPFAVFASCEAALVDIPLGAVLAASSEAAFVGTFEAALAGTFGRVAAAEVSSYPAPSSAVAAASSFVAVLAGNPVV